MNLEEQGRGLAEAMHRMKSIDFWRLISDMTPAQIQLLAAICGGDDEKQKISDLYDVCGLQPATVSRLMNDLEDRELIVRNTRKGNRRVTDVSATEQGKIINGRNLEIIHSFWKDVLGNIHSDDIDTMLRVQNEMMDCMEQILAKRMDK